MCIRDSGRADQARQLVGGEQHLLHLVGGLHIAHQPVAVGTDGVDELVGACLLYTSELHADHETGAADNK